VAELSAVAKLVCRKFVIVVISLRNLLLIYRHACLGNVRYCISFISIPNAAIFQFDLCYFSHFFNLLFNYLFSHFWLYYLFTLFL